MSKHALLSPSAAHRWLNCPPSARQCENREDTGSDYAREGSCAHQLAEFKLLRFLGKDAKDPCEHLDYYDQQMEEATDEYLYFCVAEFERLGKNGSPLMIVEQRVRYEEYVPQGSGSADCLIIGDGEMVVCDFKYGAGIAVDAEDNPQLKLYALGCLLAYDALFDIETVKMCVVQPRRENISTVTVSKDSLLEWAETVVKPAAELAWNGGGDFKAGEHCRFCKIKAECRERARFNMELAKHDFTEPALLENDEIAGILGKLDELVSWALLNFRENRNEEKNCNRNK